VTFTRVGQTPPTIMAGTPAAVTLADERSFVRVAAGTHVWSRFDLSALSGTGFVDADLALLEDAPGPLSAAPSIAWSGVTAASRIHGPMMGGDFLLEIQDGSGTFDGDESVTVGFDAQTFDDVMAAPMMPVSRTGDAIAAGEARFYFVRATAGGQITIDVTGTGGTDPVLEILDGHVRNGPLLAVENEEVHQHQLDLDLLLEAQLERFGGLLLGARRCSGKQGERCDGEKAGREWPGSIHVASLGDATGFACLDDDTKAIPDGTPD